MKVHAEIVDSDRESEDRVPADRQEPGHIIGEHIKTWTPPALSLIHI